MESLFADIEDFSEPRQAPRLRLGGRSGVLVHSATEDYLEIDMLMAGTASIDDDSLEDEARLQQAQRRTVELEARYFEDYGSPLNQASRAAFECFMKYNPVGMPLLGAEPDGRLIATWVKSDECLSIRFCDRYRLDYAVSFNNADGQVRRWGTAFLNTIFSECPHAKRLTSL